MVAWQLHFISLQGLHGAKATRDQATSSYCIAQLHTVQAMKPEAVGSMCRTRPLLCPFDGVALHVPSCLTALPDFNGDADLPLEGV